MTFYLIRAKMSQDAMRALVDRPEDRLVTTTRFLQGVGGRLHNYFFSFGEYDIVLVFELPDNVSAASLAMVLSASGSVTEVETTALITMEEAIAAMQKAGDIMGVYVPPGRGLSIKSKTAKKKPIKAAKKKKPTKRSKKEA
jgi:uncharacterized protein with GYD domain